MGLLMSMSIRLTMDTSILNPTAMVTTFTEVVVMEDTVVMVITRELLSQDMAMLQVMTTESKDSKVTMVMAMAITRELLSQVTMAVVTPMSTSPVPTIMEIMDMTFTTLTTQDMDMVRDQLNLDTMATAMGLPTAISMFPDITLTMELKFTILTKSTRLSERDCTLKNVSRYK